MLELLLRCSFQCQAEEVRQGKNSSYQMRNWLLPNVIIPQWCKTVDIFTAVLMDKPHNRDAMLNDTWPPGIHKDPFNLQWVNYDCQGYDHHFWMEH